MATLDDLQQQLAALSARVDDLTTPPDDYYTSKYSGEEIDAGIKKTESLPESWPLPIASGGTGADSAQLALTNLGGRPNRNLIINHRMIGTGDPGSYPINQRGKKVYTPDWNQYAIDGWSVEANQELKIEIKNGLVTATNTSADRELQLKQIFPSNLLTEGEPYTLSVYAMEVSGGVRFQVGMTDSPYTGVCIMTPKAGNIVSATVDKLPAVSSGSWKVIVYLPAGASVTIADQKFEPGKVQTLGWKDSSGKVHLFETLDYGETLAQCQRQLYIPATGTASTYYSAVINPTSGDIFFPVILPVPMRATPVITVTQATLYVGNEQKTVTPSAVTCYGLRGNQAMCRANGVAAGVSAKTGIVEIGGLQLSAEL